MDWIYTIIGLFLNNRGTLIYYRIPIIVYRYAALVFLHKKNDRWAPDPAEGITWSYLSMQ